MHSRVDRIAFFSGLKLVLWLAFVSTSGSMKIIVKERERKPIFMCNPFIFIFRHSQKTGGSKRASNSEKLTQFFFGSNKNMWTSPQNIYQIFVNSTHPTVYIMFAENFIQSGTLVRDWNCQPLSHRDRNSSSNWQPFRQTYYAQQGGSN